GREADPGEVDVDPIVVVVALVDREIEAAAADVSRAPVIVADLELYAIAATHAARRRLVSLPPADQRVATAHRRDDGNSDQDARGATAASLQDPLVNKRALGRAYGFNRQGAKSAKVSNHGCYFSTGGRAHVCGPISSKHRERIFVSLGALLAPWRSWRIP